MLSNISMRHDRGMSENCDSTWTVVKMQPRDARWSLLALSLYTVYYFEHAIEFRFEIYC